MGLNAISIYNEKHEAEALKLLLKDKRLKNLGKGDVALSINETETEVYFKKTDRGWIVQKEISVVSTPKNVWNLKKGDFLTPFDIFEKVSCKGNTSNALMVLNNRLLSVKPPYIRIGVDYFRVNESIDNRDITRTQLLPWTKQAISDDYSKEIFEVMPKYIGFGLFPDNKNYERTKNGMYNQYSEFSHKAFEGDVTEKDIPWSLNLIKHIWGEQYELGLIYMKVLYLYPKQILPILALVSSERETGKSTFGDLIGIMYGDNSCVISPSDIGSSHNSSYADKNIILIEETKIDRAQDLEKIKTLSTQKRITINPKFIKEYSLDFYGKIIMFSNHEDRFVRIDEEENRYWVLKVPTLKGKANHNILDDLTKEIPKFLRYLEQLPEIDFSRSRMVFTQEEIATNILERTKLNSRSGAHKDILIRLEQEMMENIHKEYIYFRHEDLHAKYFQRGSNYSVSYISDVIRNEMKLVMDNRTRECLIGETERTTQVRAYRVKNDYYEFNGEQPDVPF
jgi:hypothetical protein